MSKRATDQHTSLVSEVLTYSISDIFLMGYSFVLTKIFWPGAVLVRRPISIRNKRGLTYGKGFTTGRNCRIELFGDGEIHLGENCCIGDCVHIVSSGRVTIGDNCLFASKIFISDTSHGSYGSCGSHPSTPPNERPLTTNHVAIGNNVWLGENVVVLPGVSIGDGCVIGSNAVVSRSIPRNCIAVGCPASPIKVYDEAICEWVKY